MDAVIGHFDYPKEIPCPMPLLIHNQRGDNMLLVSGGLLDQPVDLWFSSRVAGYYWMLLEQSIKKDGLNPKTNGWSISDWEVWDELIEARSRVNDRRARK